jgi:hypothetical protein
MTDVSCIKIIYTVYILNIVTEWYNIGFAKRVMLCTYYVNVGEKWAPSAIDNDKNLVLRIKKKLTVNDKYNLGIKDQY